MVHDCTVFEALIRGCRWFATVCGFGPSTVETVRGRRPPAIWDVRGSGGKGTGTLCSSRLSEVLRGSGVSGILVPGGNVLSVAGSQERKLAP